ncbi:MAG: diacylglycerol kinase family lipid kinase [Dehalococcoidia bacterium]|nr:MAG: diacylglycerol kinase family lipid kinase [Dehalococcoidia bacterium]
MQSATVIVNPVAPNLPSRRHLREAAYWLHSQGWQAEWALTRSSGDAIAMAARAAQEGRSLVVICGGDGTLNEAANGLAGSETALAVIPAGTANVWAKEVGIPRQPIAALEVAIRGQARRIDLGRASSPSGEEERYFFMMAGLGLDGSIAASLPVNVKRYLGAATYGIMAIGQSLTYRGQRVKLIVDGEPLETRLLMMVVGNTRHYAGVTQVTPRAYVDDGLLDACIFQGRHTLDIIFHTLRVAAQAHLRASPVLYRRVRRLEVRSETPLPVQLDGDFYPGYPTVFEVVPAALTMMVSQKRLPLFRHRTPRP